MQIGPEDREPRSISGEEWVKVITASVLEESVPEEVRDLFETARGALVYGYFFYPLYALGEGQLFRVVEAAVTNKCKVMGAPARIKRFYDRVEWLVSQGVIPKQEKGKWDVIRELRNFESHPERQTLLPPGTVVGMLRRIAEEINALFRASVKDEKIVPAENREGTT